MSHRTGLVISPSESRLEALSWPVVRSQHNLFLFFFPALLCMLVCAGVGVGGSEGRVAHLWLQVTENYIQRDFMGSGH